MRTETMETTTASQRELEHGIEGEAA